MNRKKDASRCGEGKIVALAALWLRFEGVRDRRAGPFPSPVRNPALQHEAGGLIDELELVVVDAASQSECLWEKLTYVAGVTAPPYVPCRLCPSRLAMTTVTKIGRAHV